ncbi:MAG: glycosyltransferase family 2 protein [Trueperaceae bacterium]|nr:glycosyltransferase family 2 protein [Trueperaceae bacterium]
MTGDLLRCLTHDAVVGILAFQAVMLLVVLSNAVVLLRPRRGPRQGPRPDDAEGPLPLVSLLVPARNEAANVGTCVRSLLAQRYPRLELLVLDDRSDDDTPAILARERARDARLVVLEGVEPPPGWTGKNWACHQLSLAARGEVLLFADADTEFFDPDAVQAVIRTLQASRADLLSGLPRQVLGTLSEKLLVPMFYWAFLSFTPLALGLVWRRPAFARAVGQLMAFRRDAYDAIGGHAAVRGSVVDDLDLARRVAGARLACRVMDATSLVRCRMYRSGREAAAGFAKNLFAAFGYAILPYAFVWGWLAYAHLEPVTLLALHAALPAGVAADPTLLVASIALALATWVLAYARLRLPIWPALIYPLTLVGFLAVALRSFVDGVRRRATWKGRAVERPPTRWV